MGIVREIKFDEGLHKYTDQDRLVYTSVTTLIGKYHDQFDKEFWAKNKSEDLSIYNEYRGMSSEQIKAHWNDITVHSQNKGNKTHKILEDSINKANRNASFEFDQTKSRIGSGLGLIKINKTNINILAETPLAKKYPKIYNFLKNYIEDGWTLYAEKRIYWFDFLIAGTIDCLLMKDNLFMIVDWKTNKKKLEFRSGYYKKVNGLVTSQWINKDERFHHPLQNIPFCKGNVYTLQLSLYAYLMELWGFKCIALTLFHILNDVVQDPYVIPYWKQSCEKLTMHHKLSLSNPNNTNNGYNKNTSFGIF